MNCPMFRVSAGTSFGHCALQQAILLYGASGSTAAHATVHPINMHDGVPQIGAGRAMTYAASAALARALDAAPPTSGFLPPDLLAASGNCMLWWVPPARRTIRFAAGELSPVATSVTAMQPGLVFLAKDNGWMVWAVKGRQRPTPQTRLYRAPYCNVSLEGTICAGTVVLPTRAIGKLDEWNAAFFDTCFTHPNSAKQVRYKSGLLGMWRDLASARIRAVPEYALICADLTIDDIMRKYYV